MRDIHNIEPLAYPPDGAARRLGVSLRQLNYLITNGEIRSIKINNRRLIPEDELKAYLRRKMAETDPHV